MSAAGPIEQFDRAVDAAFDHLRGKPALDRLFYVASELGDFSLIWHVLGAAQGAVRPDGPKRATQLAAAIGLESLLVNGVVKEAFRRERPIVVDERPHKLRTPRTTSFPSGHASSAFFAAALLSDGSRAKPLYYATAAVVATSRIHVRIHHASDVVGGALLGAALGSLARRLLRGR